MDEKIKTFADSLIQLLHSTLLEESDVVEAQKTLIMAMGESLKTTEGEIRDYIFEGGKGILKELFEKEVKA